MSFRSLKSAASAALAALALSATAAGAAHATGTVEVFNRATMGSVDFRQMGYTDESGEFVSLVGQRILGAWAEVDFDPAQRKDGRLFTVQMVVPVEGGASQLFQVEASQLIPVGRGRYRAAVTSNLFNGTVRDGRYSIETFGTNAQGERVPVRGTLGPTSGFHFIVTRPD